MVLQREQGGGSGEERMFGWAVGLGCEWFVRALVLWGGVLVCLLSEWVRTVLQGVAFWRACA